MPKKDQLIWGLPLTSVLVPVGVISVFVLIGSDADVVYIFIIAPVLLVACLTLLVWHSFRRRFRQVLSVLIALILFVATSGLLIRNQQAIRPRLRWILFSSRWKSQVAQTQPILGELKHVEWDGWGGAPVGDWTAYVVFDPTDSLEAAAHGHAADRFAGIPCPISDVRRLEKHWYSVTLNGGVQDVEASYSSNPLSSLPSSRQYQRSANTISRRAEIRWQHFIAIECLQVAPLAQE